MHPVTCPDADDDADDADDDAGDDDERKRSCLSEQM